MRSLLIACLFFLSACCTAATRDACPKGGEWAAACFTTAAEVRQVRSAHLPKIAFGKSGKALVLISEPRELVAVNRRGVVVVPGIFHSAAGGKGRNAPPGTPFKL